MVPLPSTAPLLHYCALVYPAVPADQNVVLNHHGHGAHGFQNSADLRSRRDVAIAPNLSATANQRMRIDHGSVVDVSAGVDVHRRHAGDATAHIATIPQTGAARHHSNTAVRVQVFRRVGVLIEELERPCSRHFNDSTNAEAEQDAFLDPRIHSPAGWGGGIGFGCANAAFV